MTVNLMAKITRRRLVGFFGLALAGVALGGCGRKARPKSPPGAVFPRPFPKVTKKVIEEEGGTIDIQAAPGEPALREGINIDNITEGQR